MDLLPQEQHKDPALLEMIQFLRSGVLPTDEGRTCKTTLQNSLFILVDDVLFFTSPKLDREQRIKEKHGFGLRSFKTATMVPWELISLENRLFNTHSHWWWEGRFADAVRHVRKCLQCATVSGGGRAMRPHLHPVPVNKTFQMVGVDIMELPNTAQWNKYVLVFSYKLAKDLSYP